MVTIKWSPITAILENRPAGTIITGKPGSGKTYFLLNTAANCLLTKTRVIYLDPKNDAAVLKKIDPDIEVIDINNIRPGAMNPFKVLNEVSTNSLMSVISCICGNMNDKKLVAITPIVNDFVMKNRRNIEEIDFSMLANYLYASENEDAQSIGTMLKVNEDSKYGKLLFAPCENEFSIKDGKSFVISLLGMDLPNAQTKKEDITQEQRFTSAIVYILCKLLREILTEDNKIPTVLIVDEAHIVFVNNSISAIIDQFLVLGRSLNVATILASQNISHFPKGISQLIASKFMFNMSNREAIEFLEEFDDSSSAVALDRQSIIEKITNVDIGESFFIDSKGRSAFIKIKSNLGVTSNPLLKDRDKTI